MLDPDYFFDDDGIYPSVEYNSHDPHRSYMESVEAMPMTAGPGVFGLHENANIACALAETFQMFDTIMLMEVKHYRAASRVITHHMPSPLLCMVELDRTG